MNNPNFSIEDKTNKISEYTSIYSDKINKINKKYSRFVLNLF